MTTQHFTDRVRDRLSELGYNETQIADIFAVAKEVAGKCSYDTAARVAVLEAQHNAAWSDISNGNEVWAIIQDGSLVTMMFRRSTQPKSVQSLRVKKIWLYR